MAGITLYRADEFRQKLSADLGVGGDDSRVRTFESSDLGIGLIKDFVGLKAVDAERREASFVISDSGVDRDRDVISAAGWDLKSFRKNPVVLWAHNSFQPPIGVATKLKREGDQLFSTVRFSEENPMGDLVWRMIQAKELRASSVGFRPTKFEFVRDDEERAGGIDFLKQELLEWSVVPIPANPRALIQLHGLKVDTRPLKEYCEWALDEKIRGVAVSDLERAWKTLDERGVTIDLGSFGELPEPEVEVEESAEEPETEKAPEEPDRPTAIPAEKLEQLVDAVMTFDSVDDAIKHLTEKAEVRIEIREKEVVVVKDPTVLQSLAIIRDFYEQCGDEEIVDKIKADLKKFRAAGVAPTLEDDESDDDDPDKLFDDVFGKDEGDDDETFTIPDATAEDIERALASDDDDDGETIEVPQDLYEAVTGSATGSSRTAAGD